MSDLLCLAERHHARLTPFMRTRQMRWILTAVAITVLGGVFSLTATRPTMFSPTRDGTANRATAPAIPSDSAWTAPAWEHRSWLNSSAPIALASLRGRVVLLNFWVFTCYNCTNTLPSLRLLDAKYRDRGLSMIGIHTPEFPPYAGEHDRENVASALKKYQVTWPVAQDNDRASWDRYRIRYWPSFVLIDKQGRVRFEGHGEFHEGDRWHAEWDRRIATLLAE